MAFMGLRPVFPPAHCPFARPPGRAAPLGPAGRFHRGLAGQRVVGHGQFYRFEAVDFGVVDFSA